MIPCRFSDDIPDIRIFLGILPLLQYSPCGKKRVILALLCLLYHTIFWVPGGGKRAVGRNPDGKDGKSLVFAAPSRGRNVRGILESII
jgi:hypothetical protein